MNNQVNRQQDWLNSINAGLRGFQTGRLGDAVAAFNQAVQILPERVEGWVNLGSALLEARQYNSAAKALQKAVSVEPKFMAAHLTLGDALRQLGNVPRSIESYRQAVALQKTVMGLNKLACALRITKEVAEAAALYREAIAMEPQFTLAQVNLATLLMEMSMFDEAGLSLGALAKLNLPPAERAEVTKSQQVLSDYFLLKQPLEVLVKENDRSALEQAITSMHKRNRPVDEVALKTIRKYAGATHDFSAYPAIALMDLPDEWPLIEALFMIPMVNTVGEYRELKTKIHAGEKVSGDLLESLNMEPLTQAARAARQDMHDPIKAELHLRHWHALASKGVEGLFPGHFKYTQNWNHKNPTLKRVEPALASSTFRHFISEIYSGFEPGITRAVIVWMTVCDLHAFADGNGRVALSWLNRELEWAGLMPALFTKELGIKGELAAAMKIVRNGSGDLSPVCEAIVKAQQHAVAFCEEFVDG